MKETDMNKIRELMHWNRPSSILIRKADSLGSALASVQEDMNRALERFYNGLQVHLTDWDDKAPAAPLVNVTETADGYRLEAEMAGTEPRNVEVEAAGGAITIRGERVQEKDEKKEEAGCSRLRQEISYGSFLRTVALPEAADCEKAKASFRNGILTVQVPKKPEALQKPRKIEVKTAA
jgi:HSP20 family protein